MAIAITNTLISALNADQTLTLNVATVDSANGTEVFTYTPTGKPSKVVIGFVNGTGHGAYTYSIAKGVGVFQAPAAKTGSIAETATEVIQLDMGRYTTATGTVLITLAPANGKKLKSEHVATMWVTELL